VAGAKCDESGDNESGGGGESGFESLWELFNIFELSNRIVN